MTTSKMQLVHLKYNYAGQLCGCEAAVDSMYKVFESHDTEAAVLVDANNAFNSLNR